MSCALVVWMLCAPAGEQVDTAVVCPSEFREALAPWLAHRRAQGHRVAVLSNMKSAAGLRGDIRRVAQGGSLRYVVLVGDADPAMYSDPQAQRRCIPAHYSKAVVNVRFGSTSEIATDNWYADLDDDRVPDVAVGRLPCDSAEELSALVRKIVDYERSDDFGQWRRQVHFVAGLGGFGPLADAVLEAAAKSLIGGGIPAAYATTMTYGSWQSPYCPDPRRFQQVTLERLNEGSLFWVYMGHGAQCAMDEVLVPGARYPILSSPDTSRLACRHGAPIACLLACSSGAYDQPRDCLAEDMLRSRGGPVAVLCGSRVTMPYAMSVLGLELLHQCFFEQTETLGEAMLLAKRRMVSADPPTRYRAALDGVARALSPTAQELDAERAEHLDLFNLLGDPLLRIAYPRDVKLEVAPTAEAGQNIVVTLDSPLAGTATLEFTVRRDRLTFRPQPRGQFDPDALDAYAKVYERANQPRLAIVEMELEKGPTQARFAVPPEARGACHVRIFVEGREGCGVGSADVRVEPPRSTARRP